MALRSCSWIWAKNHEPRGCIGCHEGWRIDAGKYVAQSRNSSFNQAHVACRAKENR
jgi:hypothetical protein